MGHKCQVLSFVLREYRNSHRRTRIFELLCLVFFSMKYNKTMSSTGPMQQQQKCGGFGQCDTLEYDDSKCAGVCKGCVGIPDFGQSNKCTSACRKCRNFGNTWQPRRPMRPLPYTDMYNDAPGYATTGDFVEHFGVSDIMDNMFNMFLAFVAFFVFLKIAGPFRDTSLPNIVVWAVVSTALVRILKSSGFGLD